MEDGESALRLSKQCRKIHEPDVGLLCSERKTEAAEALQKCGARYPFNKLSYFKNLMIKYNWFQQ